MTTYADFSSLLQLGAGVGIGLSLFRSPVELRVDRIKRNIASEIRILRSINTEFGKRKFRLILSQKLILEEATKDLEKAQLPYLIASVLFALINTGWLIYVSLNSGEVAGRCFAYGAIFVSVFSYVLIFGIVQIIAYCTLRPIKNELHSIISQQEPQGMAPD